MNLSPFKGISRAHHTLGQRSDIASLRDGQLIRLIQLSSGVRCDLWRDPFREEQKIKNRTHINR